MPQVREWDRKWAKVDRVYRTLFFATTQDGFKVMGPRKYCYGEGDLQVSAGDIISFLPEKPRDGGRPHGSCGPAKWWARNPRIIGLALLPEGLPAPKKEGAPTCKAE